MNKDIEEKIKEILDKFDDILTVENPDDVLYKRIRNRTVAEILSLISLHYLSKEELKDKIEKTEMRMSVSEYLPKVQAWDGKNYDVPFDDGYVQAKKDILDLLSQLK